VTPTGTLVSARSSAPPFDVERFVADEDER